MSLDLPGLLLPNSYMEMMLPYVFRLGSQEGGVSPPLQCFLTEFLAFLRKCPGISEVANELEQIRMGEYDTVVSPASELTTPAQALIPRQPQLLVLPQDDIPWELSPSTAANVLEVEKPPARAAFQNTQEVQKMARRRLADQRNWSLEWAALCTATRDIMSKLFPPSQSKRLYATIMNDFSLYVLDSFLGTLEREDVAALQIDQAAAVLKSIGRKAAGELLSGFLAVKDFPLEKIKIFRDRQHSLLRALVDAKKAQYKLVSSELRIERRAFKVPSAFGKQAAISQADIGLEDRIRENLNGMGFQPSSEAGQISSLLHEARSKRGSNRRLHLLLAMQSAERFFLELRFEEGSRSVDHSELMRLHDIYRLASQEIMNSEADQVGRRSKDALVALIVFCTIDALAVQTYSRVGEFGVPLDAVDIEALSALEKGWIKAARRVHSYIWRRSQRPNKLFSVARDEDTWAFAAEFAFQDSPDMLQTWREEQVSMGAREDTHWADVQEKQQRAKRLRVEIQHLKQERDREEGEKQSADRVEGDLENAKDRMEKARDEFYRNRHADWAIREKEHWEMQVDICQQKVNELPRSRNDLCNILNDLFWRIRTKETELEQAETCPPAVYQPLPRHEPAALTVIFFMQMPSLLRSLSQSAFFAQQSLRPFEIYSELECLKQQWSEYFNGKQLHNAFYHRPMNPHHGMDGAVQLRSTGKLTPEQDVAGRHIDHLQSKHDGVFYPDAWDFKMSWQSDGTKVSQGHFLNPWESMPPEHVAAYFTPALGRDSLTKYLPIEAGNLARGNWSLAYERDSAPSWARRTWLAFAGLRASPCLQYHRLAAALEQGDLPLDDENCQALITHTLAHLGELGSDSRLVWRNDLVHGMAPQAIRRILKELCDCQKNAPGKIAEVSLLALIAGFFSQWLPELASSLEELATSALGWAKEHAKRIADSPEMDGALRARICAFCHGAVLCCRFVPMTSRAAEVLARSMVFFKHHSSFFETPDQKRELANWQRDIEMVLGARAEAWAREVQANTSIVSEAVRVVLDAVPADLSWSCMESFCCYRTGISSAAGCSYQVNLLNGIVLMNGHLPSRLPEAIVANMNYQSVFEDRQFDITMVEEGIFQTTTSHSGRRYEFARIGKEVQIEELLDFDHRRLRHRDPKTLGDELPTSLVKCFSHWQDGDYLLFRPQKMMDKCFHHVIWILKLSTGECVRVPEHLREQSSLEYRGLFASCVDLEERLVPLPVPLARVLTKFEDPKLVYCFTKRTSTLVAAAVDDEGDEETNMPSSTEAIDSPKKSEFYFEMPRFKLSFELKCKKLWSLDYKGFFLAEDQQSTDCLPYFEKYLVMHKSKPHTSAQVRMLVPKGTVVPCGERTVSATIQIDGAPNLRCGVVRYDLHPRFGTLEAESIADRLQLAALFVAAGSSSEDGTSGSMAGLETAMDLVRKSWTDRPLRTDEQEALQNVLELSGSSPGLEALVRELDLSSSQLLFLHEGSSRALEEWPSPVDEETGEGGEEPRVLAARCIQETAENPGNWRRSLTEKESSRLFGRLHCHVGADPIREDYEVDVDPCSDNINIVAAFENELQTLLKKESYEAPSAEQEFPFRTKVLSSEIEMEMHASAKASWAKNQEQLKSRLGLLEEARATKTYLDMLNKVQTLHEEKESYIWKCLKKRATVKSVAAAAEVGFITGSTCSATLAEICRMAVDEELMATVNPCLTPEARGEVKKAILQLLQLIVLEDKLLRLATLAGSNDSDGLRQELQVHRCFDPQTYPEWLVFEVSTCLQIRPVQVEVAMALLEGNKGDIVQLNMGEGKTRVILPMLVLAEANGKSLVRVTALQQLLDDLANHFHRVLTASPLGRKVHRMPFNRDVRLTEEMAKSMMHSMQHCLRAGGVMVVAPEHRLSMALKRQELLDEGGVEHFNVAELIGKLAQELPFFDVLDESDEILSHVRQVVYAMGDPEDLPDARWRWLVPQALLRAMLECHKAGRFEDIPEEAMSWDDPNLPEAFGDFRLKPGTKLEGCIGQLKASVLQQLFDSPPHDLSWLQGYHGQFRQDLLDFALGKSCTIADLPKELPDEQKATMLALRGYMAGGIFERCLSKRSDVDFGLRPGGKHLAIPYRGSHTPSLRSEFAQAEPALLLTDRSWYNCGLSETEVLETFRSLNSCNLETQRNQYDSWFSLSRQRMPQDEQEKIDSWTKVDLTNREHHRILHKYFSRNFEVINWFLAKIILPRETAQFASKISANAWHLGEGPRVNGFSGTCSNLLPLNVQMAVVDKLAHTDGHMINLLIKHGQYMQWSQKQAFIPWLVGEAIATKNVRALVDAGAYTVQWSNHEFAQELLPQLPSDKFKGVVFFHTEQKEWVVYDRHSRMLPLHSSPSEASECFAFYDETRTRGADLRLEPTAVAALTLAPSMRKDSLMQGAGRMRQLGRQQSVILVGTPEVDQQIRFYCDCLSEVSTQDGAPTRTEVETESNELNEEALQNTSDDSDKDSDNSRSNVELAPADAVILPTKKTSTATSATTTTAAATSATTTKPPAADASSPSSPNTSLNVKSISNPEGAVIAEDNLEEVSPTMVLEWAFGNECKNIAMAMPEFARQGAGFLTTHRSDDPAVYKVPEENTLEGLFGGSLEARTISDVILGEIASFTNRPGVWMEEADQHMLAKLQEQERKFQRVHVEEAADEEHERELEKEVEREQEEEVERANTAPQEEIKWDVEQVFNCKTLEELKIVLERKHVQVTWFSMGTCDRWPMSIACTSNFKNVVSEDSRNVVRLGEFLLVLPDGSWVLLAQLEAERLLQAFWSRGKAVPAVPFGVGCYSGGSSINNKMGSDSLFLTSFCFLRRALVEGMADVPEITWNSLGGATEGVVRQSWRGRSSTEEHVKRVVAVSILNADCRFQTPGLRSTLDAALCSDNEDFNVTTGTVYELLTIHRANLLAEGSDLSKALMKCKAALLQRGETSLIIDKTGSIAIWNVEYGRFKKESKHLASPSFAIRGLQDVSLELYDAREADRPNGVGLRLYCGVKNKTALSVEAKVTGSSPMARKFTLGPDDGGQSWRCVADWTRSLEQLRVELKIVDVKQELSVQPEAADKFRITWQPDFTSSRDMVAYKVGEFLNSPSFEIAGMKDLYIQLFPSGQTCSGEQSGEDPEPAGTGKETGKGLVHRTGAFIRGPGPQPEGTLTFKWSGQVEKRRFTASDQWVAGVVGCLLPQKNKTTITLIIDLSA